MVIQLLQLCTNQKEEYNMGFSKEFLWGGATAANQCEGGYREGKRGIANIDLLPIGEERFAVASGKVKKLEFDDKYFLGST